MRKSIDLAAEGVPSISHTIAEEEPVHGAAVFGRRLSPPDLDDRCSRLTIPQTLFGRESELAALESSVEGLVGGESSLLLVSGPSGCGKSSLIATGLQRLGLSGRVHVATASYEPDPQAAPYSALRQALSTVVRQILAEDDAIAHWRQRLNQSLGANGQVMVDLIPELGWLLGPQPALAELASEAHRNRFLFTLGHFVAALAPPDHPLILVLDNLHWADEGSLELLVAFAGDPQPRALLLIGAYRTNPASPGGADTHSLPIPLAALEETGMSVQHLALTPLSLCATNDLVAALLHDDPRDTLPLGERIQLYTLGNPFFVVELMQALVNAGAIGRVTPGAGWRWDLAAVDRLDLGDDVAELLAGALRRLPEATQRLLTVGALLGSSFDLATLAQVQQTPVEEGAADLQPALQAGLLVPLDSLLPMVRFRHDRIRETAQAGLTGEARQALHLRVGQALLPTLTPAEEVHEEDDAHPGRERFLHAGADYLPDDPLYRVVHHLNAAVDLIFAPDERRQLAELNLQAGRQAASAAAYDAAWRYFYQGLTLLAAGEMWTDAYDLALALHVEGAEAAYLSAHHEAVEPLASQATAHARDATDRARAYQVWIQAAIARNELDQAMDLMIDALAQLGIRLPADRLRLRSDLRKLPGAADKPVSAHDALDEAPTDNARSLITVLGSLARTRWALRGRRIEDLAELPPVTDPSLRIAGSIMASIGQSLQMQGSPHRIALITLEAMRLSLRHGLFPTSAVVYAAYGAILCMLDTVPGLGDVDTAYRMGQLAMRLADQPEVQPYRARITVPVQYLVNHRRVHHRESLAPLLAGYQAGLESGDPEGAALCALCYVSHAYQLGLPLDELEHQIADFAAVVAQLRQHAAELALAFNHQTVLNLLGRAHDPLRLTGERCDEEAARAELEQSGSSGTLTAFLVLKAYLAYLFHDTDAALALAGQMQPHIGAIAGFLAYARCLALDALIRLDRCHQAGSAERRRLVRQAQADLRRLQPWAKQVPMNHLHDVRLVEAELAWVQGRTAEAAAHYAAAIRLCQEHGWASDAPLAAERAARFYLASGQTEQARDHLRLARAGYVRWGALAVVQHFDRVYADWLPKPAIPSSQQAEPPSTAAGLEGVVATPPHFSALLKAAHAVASEAELTQQLQRLMAILIEQTGAQRGVLLIPDFVEDPAGETVASLRVEADCLAGGPCHVLQAQPLIDQDLETAAAPRRVVNFVVHSRQSLALPAVTKEPPFASDPAVLARQVSSLLCLPLRQQRQLIGVLYLENLPAPEAFTTQEGDVLSLLATQAALSVQNARLREGGPWLTGSEDRREWSGKSGMREAKEASGDLRVSSEALASSSGDDEMAAREGVGEAERWAAARMRQARLHLREGRWTEANAQVDEALALAQQASDRTTWRPIALGFGSELAVLPGGLRRCQVVAQQAGALIPAGDDDWQMGLLAQQATAAWLSGRLSEALAAYRQALALVPPKTARWTAAPSDLLGLAASVHTAQRNYDQAQQTLDSLATHLRHAGLGETREIGWRFRQARLDWLRGTAAASGSVAGALRFLDARANNHWAPVLLPVLQGLAAMVEGRPEIAERYLREAAGVEEAIPSVAVLVRPSLLLAHVLFAQGATEAALDVVTPVLEACRRGHTAGLIVQEGTAVIPVLRLAAQQGRCGPMAAHVLSLMGVSNVARRLLLPETGIVLSPREVDVLEMLAANASNRAIAERMDVDMTTVKSHVTRVLAKLGVRTRYEAAERARELGLGNGW